MLILKSLLRCFEIWISSRYLRRLQLLKVRPSSSAASFLCPQLIDVVLALLHSVSVSLMAGFHWMMIIWCWLSLCCSGIIEVSAWYRALFRTSGTEANGLDKYQNCLGVFGPGGCSLAWIQRGTASFKKRIATYNFMTWAQSWDHRPMIWQCDDQAKSSIRVWSCPDAVCHTALLSR